MSKAIPNQDMDEVQIRVQCGGSRGFRWGECPRLGTNHHVLESLTLGFLHFVTLGYCFRGVRLA